MTKVECICNTHSNVLSESDGCVTRQAANDRRVLRFDSTGHERQARPLTHSRNSPNTSWFECET